MTKTMIAYILAATLTACAMVTPQERPKTLAEQIEVVELQITAAYNIVASMVTTKTVSAELGKGLIESIDSANNMVDLASVAQINGDITTATGQLQAAQAALAVVNQRIAQLEKANGN